MHRVVFRGQEQIVLTFREFNALLVDAADVHPVSLSPNSRDDALGMLLELGAASLPVRVRIGEAGVELSAEDHALLAGLKEARRKHRREHRDKIGAEVEVLEEHRLPLYWNREWLESKLDEVGSFGAVAREFRREIQGATSNTIAALARDRFGISARDRRILQRNRFLRDFEALHQELPQVLFARKYHVTESTISRWIEDARAAFQAMEENRAALEGEESVASFASEHSLLPNTVNHWLAHGSVPYSEPPASHAGGGAQRYYERGRYEELQQEFFAILAEEGDSLNQSLVALKLGVDRGTLRKWMDRAYFKPDPYK